MIDNIIHFIFGLKKQTEEFLFCYYLSVFSAFIVNNPEKIYFYYHYLPYGKWWIKLKKIACIEFIKIDLPTKFGEKKIIKYAHKADKIRMDVLYKKGGIYMDIDTISYMPYKHLLNNEVVLGIEISADKHPDRICNAIMMSTPKSNFFELWLNKYENNFNPNGWGESSLFLPKNLSDKYPKLVKIVNPDVFFLPGWNEIDNIFKNNIKIPKNLITLHLWETTSLNYLNKINGWEWCRKHSNTLYGKIMIHLIDKYKLETT